MAHTTTGSGFPCVLKYIIVHVSLHGANMEPLARDSWVATLELRNRALPTEGLRRRAWSFFWRTLFRFILAHCYNFWHVRIAETPGFQIFSIRLLQARKAFRSKNARNDQRSSVLLNLMIGRRHAVRLQLHICLGPNSRLGWRYGSKDAILCVWKAGFLALQF